MIINYKLLHYVFFPVLHHFQDITSFMNYDVELA